LGTDADLGPTLDRAALMALCRARRTARGIWPAVFLVWTVFAYRRPLIAGLLLGTAAGSVFFPLFLFPLWFGFYRGRVIVHAPAVAPFAVAWQGEAALALPHGSLEFAWCTGAGIAREALEADAVTVRSRAGGERLRPAAGRPARMLKRLLQDARMPAWQRESLPLVFCGDVLAVVPGIGVDLAFQANPDAPGCRVVWRPKGREC
jgi:tRNA(Ile)-lysidine synthetase-like protein